jgi:hypothetical protein
MKKLMIRIVVMLTCLFVCHIQAPEAVADKFFQNRTKRLYRNNKGDNTPSDKHNQNLANLAAKYRFESFMRISRKLTPKEMKQIAKQNHRINGKNKIINLSLNQIRIIDFNSILNGLEGDLGKNIIDNYRSFVKKGNEQSWIDELRKFPNKNGKIIIENNNANPIKLDSNQCINQLLENLNSSQIKHNKTFRQNLMIFMLVNKLRSIIDKNHKTKLVNNNNVKNLFL